MLQMIEVEALDVWGSLVMSNPVTYNEDNFLLIIVKK